MHEQIEKKLVYRMHFLKFILESIHAILDLYRVSQKIYYNPGISTLLFRRLVLFFRVSDKTRYNAARVVLFKFYD